MRKSNAGWLCTAALSGFLSSFLSCLIGCGDPNAIKTYPTSGTITYKSKPLERATVVFSSPGKEGQPSTILGLGETDASGKYVIKTQLGPTEALNGAVAGHHLVTVSKYVPPNGMSEEELERLMRKEVAAMEEKGFVTKEETAPSRVPFLPAKYQNPASSQLTAEVVAGEKNEFDFDLK
jgi:hypothetical protein